MKNAPLRPTLRNLTLVLNLFAVLALIVVFAQSAGAQTETVLYSFCAQSGCADGAVPDSGLITDSAGNLYGVTVYGGTGNGGDGVAFKLTPTGDESVLHSFTAGPQNGYEPIGPLTLDKQGNLYGTTYRGGDHSYHVPRGDGTAFKLSPDGTETILYNFGATSTDGIEPVSGMVMVANGDFYGTTYIGGVYSWGTIFRLTPEGVETVLHDFANDSTDGGNPWASLIMDKKGNLYGTTRSGGTGSLNGGGTVFEVTAEGSYSILHNFAGYPSDGSFATGSLTLDSQGNLYGATYYGGAYGKGTVFKLAPGANSSWKETVLYNFTKQTDSCWWPFSNVVFDAKGNLYGTTFYGGTWGQGCVYEINPAGELTVLHAFGKGSDGAQPYGNIVLSQGKLYGTTDAGGAYAEGTVFKITF
jgi:uncharacterized repeat protein (TIGR03803 family)